ncbi:hypothetical protein ACUDA6_15325 [Pseudomonas ceruminis]|uniref:hypothetical protein n=1 Tax=Pseudomonas ceruminis TaxID=2740516 RepID=UPI00186106E1|nr:hypothetical protein [Pseudomonas putida]QNL88208.1 Phage integrase family site-specific recombinase [Pseudomonas putida]
MFRLSHVIVSTFNSYRTHVERLLLWSLLVAENPLLALRRSDAEAFMEFCLKPAPSWVGPVVKSRFLRKGNKAAKISVRDEYVNCYLTRYRRHLGLSPLPLPHEIHPLLSTLHGRSGLSSRHLRLLVQQVFDRALFKMTAEGRHEDEIDNLRSASLHWLRHTSATFDAPFREMKDLQADLRHNSLSTTQNTYYNSLDEQRAHSVKYLKLR